jgi:hypothetical protein
VSAETQCGPKEKSACRLATRITPDEGSGGSLRLARLGHLTAYCPHNVSSPNRKEPCVASIRLEREAGNMVTRTNLASDVGRAGAGSTTRR